MGKGVLLISDVQGKFFPHLAASCRHQAEIGRISRLAGRDGASPRGLEPLGGRLVRERLGWQDPTRLQHQKAMRP